MNGWFHLTPTGVAGNDNKNNANKDAQNMKHSFFVTWLWMFTNYRKFVIVDNIWNNCNFILELTFYVATHRLRNRKKIYNIVALKFPTTTAMFSRKEKNEAYSWNKAAHCFEFGFSQNINQLYTIKQTRKISHRMPRAKLLISFRDPRKILNNF